MVPSRYGPKPRPTFIKLEFVAVDNPIFSGGTQFTEIAWAQDCMLPKPKPMNTLESKNNVLLSAMLNINIPIANIIIAGYIT